MAATALLQNSSFDVNTKKATDVLLGSVRLEVHFLEKKKKRLRNNEAACTCCIIRTAVDTSAADRTYEWRKLVEANGLAT